MQTSTCEPVERAKPEPQKVIGLALTEPGRTRDKVFTRIAKPACRLTRLRPVSSAYASARGELILSSRYVARFKGFPITATLLPGVTLGPLEGLPRWKAEVAVNGLLHGDSDYVEIADRLLTSSTGFTLQLPGGVEALVVGEHYFEAAVEIGDPEHFGPATC
jgi:hypothetical protein